MARPSSSDPLDKFRWSVQIEEFGRAGFTMCETPSYTISTKTYRQGGDHLHPKQIVDTIDYEPITLTRGVTQNVDFDNWARRALEIVNSPDGTQAQESFRREVVISHLDRQGNAIKIYRLFGAFPIKYEPASNFSADADDSISMETLTLTYEGFTVESPGVDRNFIDSAGIIKRLTRNF